MSATSQATLSRSPATSVEASSSLRSEDANWPAFPNQELGTWPGLTIRQYIATAALQGILAHSYNDVTYEAAARDAVVHADELLRALSDDLEVQR